MIWLLKQLRLDERSTHVVHACRAHVVRVRLVSKALLVGLLLSVGGAAHRGAHGTGAFTHGHGGRHCASDDTPPVNASGAALPPCLATCMSCGMQPYASPIFRLLVGRVGPLGLSTVVL